MDSLKAIIERSLERYPDFDEFLVALELASDHQHSPGIRLDASKGVYESIVKSMLGYLDRSKSRQQLNRMTLTDASKQLLVEMARRETRFNADFIESMTHVVKTFSITRNSTGDISHGHVAPKENSSSHFVNLALSYVESTCVYLFEIFLSIDLSFELPQPYEADVGIAFNNYLDESREPIGNVLYSKALYDLDYDAYIDEQDRYDNGLI